MAIVTPKVFGYPSSYLGFAVPKSNHPCEISVGRVSAVVVSNFEVFDLLRCWFEVWVDFLAFSHDFLLQDDL